MKKLILLLSVVFISLSSNSQEVKWMSFAEAIEKTKEEPRKIIVDVYTDWCGWCKRMDANTFNHPVVAEYLNEKYYPVKLNAEQKEDITVNGHTFKFVAQGSRGYHELAAQLLNGKMSYPSIVILNEQAQIMELLPGYKEAAVFDEMIRFIGENHYQSQSWEEFQTSYESGVTKN